MFGALKSIHFLKILFNKCLLSVVLCVPSVCCKVSYVEQFSLFPRIQDAPKYNQFHLTLSNIVNVTLNNTHLLNHNIHNTIIYFLNGFILWLVTKYRCWIKEGTLWLPWGQNWEEMLNLRSLILVIQQFRFAYLAFVLVTKHIIRWPFFHHHLTSNMTFGDQYYAIYHIARQPET